DGYRILARRDRTGVWLITRNGSDFTDRSPFMAAALKLLPVRSCIIDGEAIVCDESGLAVFELIRSHGSKMSAVLCAFDLLELDGRDLRRRPIEERKGLLAKLLHDSDPIWASYSTSITRRTVRLYFGRLAGSVARASCRSGSAQSIAGGARLCG